MAGDDWFVRNPAVVAVARGSSYLFVGPDRPTAVLDDVDVAALAEVLAAAVTPVPAATLAELCTDDTLALLAEQGILLRGARGEIEDAGGWRAPAAVDPPCGNLVVGICGVVGALAAVDQVRALAAGFAREVDVVLTPSALQFVTAHAFEYQGLRTWLDPFEPRHGAHVPHIHLAQRADLVLIAPASADLLRRLATGACSDLISLVATATAAPVVVAPAMNPQMWRHPAVARNVAQLRADGVWVVEPGIGFEVSDGGSEAAIGGIGFGNDVANLARTLATILAAASSAGEDGPGTP